MDDSTSDPDFVPPLVTLKDLQLDESFESSDSSRSDRSRSLTPFLRSTCHQHKGNTMKIFFELVSNVSILFYFAKSTNKIRCYYGVYSTFDNDKHAYSLCDVNMI